MGIAWALVPCAILVLAVTAAALFFGIGAWRDPEHEIFRTKGERYGAMAVAAAVLGLALWTITGAATLAAAAADKGGWRLVEQPNGERTWEWYFTPAKE